MEQTSLQSLGLLYERYWPSDWVAIGMPERNAVAGNAFSGWRGEEPLGEQSIYLFSVGPALRPGRVRHLVAAPRRWAPWASGRPRLPAAAGRPGSPSSSSSSSSPPSSSTAVDFYGRTRTSSS